MPLPRWRSNHASLALLCSVTLSCREPLSQVELVIGTDVTPDRLVSLSVFGVSATITPRELRRRAETEAPLWQSDSPGPDRGLDGLIGSIGLLPKQQSERAPIALLVRADVSASSAAPAARIERVAYVSFARGSRGTARVMLSLQCADAATGCASSPCTVSLRCIEQGLTCGANGQCVDPSLPVQLADGGAPDGEAPGDASTGRTVGAPRLVAPLSTSVVTASRPQFRWQNAAGATGARVELCRDRACSTVIESFVAMGERGQPSRPLARGVTVFWRAKGIAAGDESAAFSAVWQLRSRAIDGALASASSGVTGDYNGDGAADLVIAGETATNATEPAVVHVYAGGAQGVARAPSVRFTDADRGVSFGSTAVALGDVNGDGFGDFAIASHRWRDAGGVNRGRISVHLGSATGLSTAASSTLYGADPAVFFGQTITGLGDVNGDGYGDIAVGALRTEPFDTSYRGSAWVFYGGPDGISDARRTRVVPRDGDVEFGEFVSAPGDVDGDGFADLAVSAERNGVAPTRDAWVRLYRGSAMGIALVPLWEHSQANDDTLGEPVISLGDVNGDGLADFAVSNWTKQRADVFVGRRDAAPFRWPSIERANPRITRFSEAMAGADVNGDGFDDLVIGEPSIDTGSAWLYLSDGATTLREATQFRAAMPLDNAWFGCAVAAGDSDGDGRPELCFGARTTVVSGLPEAGLVRCVWLRSMGATVAIERDLTFVGIFANQWFGNRVGF
ncbi:MAG: FG-GAP-like repeat-containing protein [Polyangiales bacterium]